MRTNLTRSRPVYGAMVIGALAMVAVVGRFLWHLHALGHDKGLNAEWQRLISDGPPNGKSVWVAKPPFIPFEKIVPANNQWSRHAFIAERPSNEQRDDSTANVMILDDHNFSDDPTYMTPKGVVGDLTSRDLLCKLPELATRANIKLDQNVQIMINKRCR